MYERLYQQVFNPLYQKAIKRRKVLDYRRFLEKSQWWPRDRLLQYQWNELTKLLRHAQEQVPYWRDKFRSLGLSWDAIATYDDFRRIPITTKDEIRKNKAAMLAADHIGKTWTKHTGGSTGAPLELEYTPDSFDWREAICKRGYAWSGCEDGAKQFYLWGTILGPPTLSYKVLELIYYWIHRKCYFSCYEFTEEKKRRCLRVLNSFRPKFVVGYTSALYSLAQYLQSNGGLRHYPKAVLSAAEKIHPSQRELLQQVFRCRVFDTYGSREFSLIASECDDFDGLLVCMENLYVEIIKDDGQPAGPGEQGRLIISDLHNYGMPFIRYEIGDMAVAAEDREYPGTRGLTRIKDVVGRSLDMIRTPEGKEIHGEFFIHVMEDKKGVERFRVIQESPESLVVEIQKGVDFEDEQLHAVRQNIERVTGPRMTVDYRFVSEIPLTRTGKHRITISKVGQGS